MCGFYVSLDYSVHVGYNRGEVYFEGTWTCGHLSRGNPHPPPKNVLRSQEAHHVWSPSRLPAVCSWFLLELYVTVASLWDTLSCVVSGSSILRIMWINCPDKKE